MTPGKGESYWKPPFLGAMLVLGRVFVFFNLGFPFSKYLSWGLISGPLLTRRQKSNFGKKKVFREPEVHRCSPEVFSPPFTGPPEFTGSALNPDGLVLAINKSLGAENATWEEKNNQMTRSHIKSKSTSIWYEIISATLFLAEATSKVFYPVDKYFSLLRLQDVAPRFNLLPCRG